MPVLVVAVQHGAVADAACGEDAVAVLKPDVTPIVISRYRGGAAKRQTVSTTTYSLPPKHAGGDEDACGSATSTRALTWGGCDGVERVFKP